MKLVILTGHSQDYTLMAEITSPSKQRYAAIHGYYYVQSVITYPAVSSRDRSWAKLQCIKDAIETGLYDWIWWNDCDVVILNPVHAIQRLIDPSVNIIGGHFNEPCPIHTLHTGSFLIKCDTWSLRLLHQWIYGDDMVRFYNSNMREEDGIRYLYTTRPDVRLRTKCIPMRNLATFVPLYNETYNEIKWNNQWTRYIPGDFALHVPGCISYNSRISILCNYIRDNKHRWP